ncbi:PilW family protein [Vibrio sinaloensis]|uniref:PilW family protein n=1 Tax=Photobacterium sp. (strain ATCC 43367) TaxID=379097 RepID=UPI0020521C49|nr:prepilin-type N-terminal cleavage/methylation domain-containing protein [Vibrio sinaloensis]UPQ88301.1 prepilin-type N-terminal cleavage/methylation domain-containing protein [Vibrio sinaloensis]
MQQRGFTLIEMILTIVVGGILVLGIAGFVELGARGYVDSVDRQRLQTQAKFVLEKMSREVRHAVPNVFRSEDNCVYFYPIIYSGFYAISGNDVEFIVGQRDGLDASSFDDLSLIINPTANLNVQDDSIALNGLVTARANQVFALVNQASRIESQSVAKRYYMFDRNQERSYCIIQVAGQGRVERDGAALSDAIVSGSLNYVPATVQNNGLVHANLTFRQNGETTNFEHDIQVINVP